MRFLLYNIRYGAGAEWRFHVPVPYSGYFKRTHDNIEQITHFIKSAHADIAGLIEVDGGSFRCGWRSQAEIIAGALGHQHAYESKYGNGSLAQRLPLLKEQGNAVLTRLPVVGQRSHYFNWGVKRLVLELELENVTVLLVHLSLKFRHRQLQLLQLLEWVKEIRKPLIVAGDFNLFHGIRELQPFLSASGLRNANQGGHASYSSRNPRWQLDYVLHSRDIRVTDFRVPRVPFSDHLPLICDFEVGAESEGKRVKMPSAS